MAQVIATVLTGLLAAGEFPVQERPTPIAVKTLAFIGAAFVTAGIGFEIGSQASPDGPSSVDAKRQQVGGIALMSSGLSLLIIAAILTPWQGPQVAVWTNGRGGGLTWTVQWP